MTIPEGGAAAAPSSSVDTVSIPHPNNKCERGRQTGTTLDRGSCGADDRTQSIDTTKVGGMAKAGVTLEQVRTSNAKLKTYTSGLVALFIGATSGIGKGTLTQLARFADAPIVYIVGRSESAFAPHLKELETLNPQGKFIFTETQISLIKNVDQICDEIKQKERKLDILFLSAGCPLWGGINGSPYPIRIE